ncbi:hypothetical protein B9479_006806 [Cryptococcus floricola]|uniref:Uncharacterized protein n=1 Tax=Cryptococcus floricola TaxID=2591691 RepID=A0A5D3APH4_9TREE|nr:hypothetical protein B9479_006806 [Cryptococcus floricola]
MSANSPMLPPQQVKRPRQYNNPHSATNTPAPALPLAGNGAAGGPLGPRTKRRKPEPIAAELNREKEIEGDIKTKIDFHDLPVETLYKYLELHDLLPSWDPSPWSEEPCMPPNLLYSIPPPPPSAPPTATAFLGASQSHQGLGPSPPPEETAAAPIANADEDVKPPPPAADPAVPEQQPQPNGGENGHVESQQQAEGGEKNGVQENGNGASGEEAQPYVSEPIVTDRPEEKRGSRSPSPLPVEAPTTRSKTLPTRKPLTPPPPSPPQFTRGVVTLSDVLAARHELAEKANAHWARGLGGGQNKESETIVQFLYKMKVGPGRLLRVYNPTTSAQPPWL